MSEPYWTPLGAAPVALPAGVVVPFAGAGVPSGWLLCDGATVSRTTFAALFAAIGTTYGAGDGSTTFNLPDLRGRVAVGKGSNAAVDTLGENDGVAEANRRPQHRHTPHVHGIDQFGTGGGTPQAYNAQPGGTPGSVINTNAADGGSGVGTDALDAPAHLVLNYIIASG